MSDRHDNWIAGRWLAACAGSTFEVRAPATTLRRGEPIGRWPRSAAADAALALAAAREAGPAWRALGRAARRARLVRAAEELARDPDPGGLALARLGLAPAELEPHRAALGPALERALETGCEPAREPVREPVREDRAGGPAILVPHWSELFAGPARAALELLGAGDCVVLVSHPALPMAAEALARALERADLPPGVLALLHGDVEDALAALLASGAAERVRASGHAADLARLAHRARAGAGAGARSAGAPAFGAGVREAGEPALELCALRSATHVVPDEGDLEQEADAVAVAAFGRARTLSGQLPGQIGRVACPERRFSAFTAALLARLEQGADLVPAVPPVEADSEDAWRRMRELGLDEGATLICDGPRRARGSPREDAAGGEAPLWVFTNVEGDGRLARLSRPAPLLRLVRVADAAAGLELARHFAGAP